MALVDLKIGNDAYDDDGIRIARKQLTKWRKLKGDKDSK